MNGKFEIQIGSEHPEGCGVGVRCKVGKRAWITSVSMGWIQRDNCVERMPFRLNAYKKRNGVWTNVTRQPVMFTYTKEALGMSTVNGSQCLWAVHLPCMFWLRSDAGIASMS